MFSFRYSIVIVIFSLIIFGAFVSPLFTSKALSSPWNPMPTPWETLANMPTARHAFGVTAANGRIYVIGGSKLSPPGSPIILATVEEYDPATNSWRTRANMPTPRSGLAVVAANGKIYALGGDTGRGTIWFTDIVEEYDPEIDTWSTRASMPTRRIGFTAQTVNDKIYIIGGAGIGRDSYLGTVEEYDPLTDIWTRKADMPTARSGLSSAVGNNVKIYAISGSRDPNAPPLSTIEEYDSARNTWVRKADKLSVRPGAAVASAFNGKIYYMGGRDPYGFTDVSTLVEEYDPQSDYWSLGAPLQTGRYGLGAIGAYGKVFAIGGLSPTTGGSLASTNVVEATTPFWIGQPYEYNLHLPGVLRRYGG